MTRYAVIDFETNGLMPEQGGRALEVAAVIVEDGRIAGSWQSLMNPGVHVPSFITALTGITPAMVRAAPPPEQVMAGIADFVGDATLVAHNASFDRRFWQFELDRLARASAHDFLCTVLISRRLYQWAPNHKLATLVDLHDIPVDGRHHRALADASMTAHLFLRMQRDLAALYAGEAEAADFLQRYQKTAKAQVRGQLTASPY
ncbi:MAG: 3'-5' exonuclease [Pseudomonadota bacterium]